MRHLGSIVLAMLLIPVVYLLTGIGLVDWETAESGSKLNYARLVVALGALLVAGLVYALLLLARLSPLGLILAGLALFGVAMWQTVATSSFTHTMPRSILGVDGSGWVTAGPVSALLALPLIATLVSPRRWRKWANPPAAVAPAPAYSPPPSGYPAPPPAYPGAPQYGQQQPQYAVPTSPAGAYGAPTSAPPAPPVSPTPPATVVDPTSVMPASGPAPQTQYPPVWPSQEPSDPEATRRL